MKDPERYINIGNKEIEIRESIWEDLRAKWKADQEKKMTDSRKESNRQLDEL